MLGDFLSYLIAKGLRLDNLVVVGHSLGAHISGIAGKQLIANGYGKIDVIVGLDPAGPLFSISKPNKRLADTDAEYVHVIHTDAGRLSLENPIGHADFYPNGGNEQPGCPAGNAVTGYFRK